MSHLSKLAIAILLGLLAAITNANWLAAKKQVPLYVGFNRNVSASEVIDEDALAPIPIPGEPSIVTKTFVRWSDRQRILAKEKAIRNYRVGDLFPIQDIAFPTQERTRPALGPFRVLTINNNGVTIAFNSVLDAKTKQLLEIVENPGLFEQSIVAVRALPGKSAEFTGDAGGDVKYQTIPLGRLPYAPEAFQNNAAISFVLSQSSRY